MAKKKIYDYGTTEIKDSLDTFYGLQLNDEQKHFAKSISDKEKLVIVCNAMAGTGKTQIAVGMAEILYQYKLYDGIVCVTFPCADQKQGFLPGDITQKSEVYFEPVYQAMIKCGINPITAIMKNTMTENKYDDGYIKLLTSTYLRGVNFENKVVILDETQNGTLDEIRKVLTRCSDSCKVIVIGHTGQIDLVKKESSGFQKYIDHYEGQGKAEICTLEQNYRGWISAFADQIQ